MAMSDPKYHCELGKDFLDLSKSLVARVSLHTPKAYSSVLTTSKSDFISPSVFFSPLEFIGTLIIEEKNGKSDRESVNP